jgi:hypothetical protein
VDLAAMGLEEFEDKVDKIANGHDTDSWMGDMYKKFIGEMNLDPDNSLDSMDLDGMEPPILDETWGLGDAGSDNLVEHNNGTAIDGTASSTNGTKAAALQQKRKKRELAMKAAELEDQRFEAEAANDPYLSMMDGLQGYFSAENKCEFNFVKCMAAVAKGGRHYMNEPGGITGALRKAAFKMAFNGGFGGNFWKAAMTVPEARRGKRCLNARTSCSEYEAIKKEAADTLDDSPRLLVNPDFVEGLDESDGKEEFMPEDQMKVDEFNEM